MELLKLQDSTYEQSTSNQILLCFSIVRNLGKAFSGQFQSRDIKALHGLKCMAVFSVVWANSLKLGDLKANPKLPDSSLLKYHSSLIGTSLLLTMSCTLNTYHNMEAKYEGRFNYFSYVTKRLARLLPNYVFIVLFAMGLLPFLTTEENAEANALSNACKEDFWQVILFVNNFFKHSLTHDKCLPQSWYFAANFQLWLITPLAHHSFFKFPKITMASLLVSSIVHMSAFITMVLIVTDFNAFDYFAYQSYFYFPSWALAQVSGFLVCNQRVPGMGKKLQCAVWIAVLVFLILVPISVFTDLITNNQFVAILLILCPIISTGMVTYLSCGYGGILNSFFGHPFWLVFSKASYSVLLSYWVFSICFGISGETDAIHYLDNLYFGMGCYFWGAIAWVAIELPFREMMTVRRTVH